eukprot:4242812-Pyramimonas_sp.AAC.1
MPRAEQGRNRSRTSWPQGIWPCAARSQSTAPPPRTGGARARRAGAPRRRATCWRRGHPRQQRA